MLTPDDIKRLEMPLALEHHEARASGKNNAKTKQQWLIYITQEGVIPLLNEIDPSWTWEVRDSSKSDKYAVVTGRLTIKDVFRDGRGGNSPNSATASTNEDTEKGAETDALKRAAVKFGVGLYLRSVEAIWVDISDKPWEDEKVALEKFTGWYKRTFGAQKAPQGQPRQQPPQNAPAGNVVQERPMPASDPSVTGQTGNGNGGGSKPRTVTRPSGVVEFIDPSDAERGGSEPDADGFRRYLVHEIVVNEMPNGGRQYVAKSEIGDNIVTFGGEAFQEAGFDTSKWQANGKPNRLDPAAIIEAKFDGKRWLIRGVEVAF